MAAKDKKESGKGGKRKVSFVSFQKFYSGFTLLALVVVVVGGMISGVSLDTILFRVLVVVWGLFLVGRILLRILTTYEEMSGG